MNENNMGKKNQCCFNLRLFKFWRFFITLSFLIPVAAAGPDFLVLQDLMDTVQINTCLCRQYDQGLPVYRFCSQYAFSH